MKKFQVLLGEDCHKNLKAMAAMEGQKIGDIIQTVCSYVLKEADDRAFRLKESGAKVEMTTLALALMPENVFQQLMNEQYRINRSL